MPRDLHGYLTPFKFRFLILIFIPICLVNALIPFWPSRRSFNHTMSVLPMIHTLPITCTMELNKIPTPWTVHLSISTLLMNHVLDFDMWTICMFDDHIHSTNPFIFYISEIWGLWLWICWLLISCHRLPYLICDL